VARAEQVGRQGIQHPGPGAGIHQGEAGSFCQGEESQDCGGMKGEEK